MIKTFFMLQRFTAVDISKIEKGFATLAVLAGLFSWPGISATISRKILMFSRAKIVANDDESYYSWLASEIIQKIFVDDFDLSHIDSDSFNALTEKMLKVGQFVEIIHALLLFGFFFIERGDLEKVKYMADLLGHIGEDYEHVHAKVFERVLNVRMAVEQGRLKEAIDGAKKGCLVTERLGLKDIHLDFLSLEARAHVLLGDQDGAKTCLKHQEGVRSNAHLIPYYLSDYVVVRLLNNVFFLEEAINNRDQAHVSQLASESRKWGSQAMKASKKFKRDRVEVMRLLGTRSWLLGEREKALKWWADSVETGERLKMRTDLSRTYFEIGRRLSEPNSPYKDLNGMTSAEYLSRARAMFEEMDLQWDLEQLERLS